jgi:hypothetical protein
MPDVDCGCDEKPAKKPRPAGDTAAEFSALMLADVEDEPEVDEPDPRGSTVRRWRGLIAPYKLPTGDGRRFASGALSSRELPLPVKWQRTDAQGHSTSITVGRINGVTYSEDGVEAWGIIFDPDPVKLPRLAEDANEAFHLLTEKVIGPSVDLDDMDWHPLGTPAELSVEGARPDIEVTKGRISAITLVQIPAFAEARPFALDELDADEYAEMTTSFTAAGVLSDVTLDVAADAEWNPTAWLTRAARVDGAALYSGPEGQLFPVADVFDGQLMLVPGAVADAVSVLAHHSDRVSLGEGTKQAMRETLEALTAACGLPNPPWAQAALVASAGVISAPPKAAFENPKLDGPTPIRITDLGNGWSRVAGHLATWGTCHIGFPGSCVTAPKSRSGYSYFHTGATVTDGGEIPTGKITLGGGHADTRLGFQAAVEHYDSTSAAVADVRAGEDAHGIWVSGVVRAGTEARRVAELAASPLSGDWRRIGGRLEMVAALAVNTPGFMIPRSHTSGSEAYALVAAGVVQPATAPRALRRRAAGADAALSPRELVRQAVVEIRRQDESRTLAATIAGEFAALDGLDTRQAMLDAAAAF